MKTKLALGCALILGSFAFETARADDSPCGQCMCAPESFCGLYLGGNLGIFSHNAGRNDLDGFLTDNSGWTTIDTNLAGGVQAGYDWRFSDRVFGIVADWNGADIGGAIADTPTPWVWDPPRAASSGSARSAPARAWP
jgi:hypothetical protein